MAKSVLVIGAVLLDVVGIARDNQENSADKIGSAKFSVGGVAFNVASNLCYLGHRCQLYTCLKKKSPISEIIKRSIARMSIGVDYVVEESNIPDASYISLQYAGKSIACLTSSPIDDADILADKGLARAISRATHVVLETNLSVQQIRAIRKLCRDLSVPTSILAVSDAKANRLVRSRMENCKHELVGLSSLEYSKLGLDFEPIPARAREICDALSSKWVCISRGAEGADLFNETGSHSRIPAPRGAVVDLLGAGDALFSALCHCTLKGMNLGQPESEMFATGVIAQVIGTHRPNLNDADISVDEKEENRVNALFLIPMFVILVALVWIGLDLGTRSVEGHWASTLAAAGISGCVGSYIFSKRLGKFEEPRELWLHTIMGLPVGVFVAIITSLPSLAGSDLVSFEGFNRTSMVVHFVMSVAAGFLGGLTLTRTIERWAGGTS